MFRADLTGTELRAFHRALRGHHSLQVSVLVLNLDHEQLGDLSQEFLDGQVNFDTAGEVSRSLTLSFLDVGRTMDFDSDSPANGALYGNRMIRIVYRVRVDELARWVSIPLFTGPVVKLDRAGDVVTVECQGKEVLAQGAAWRPMTVRKGVPKVDAIRRIMRERGGESRFDLPDLKARLPKAVSMGRQASPWGAASRIAESMDRRLEYDGRGRLCLRPKRPNPVFTFSDGEAGEILTEPQLAFDTANVANVVWVKGGKPRAKRRDNETRAEFETRQDKERGIRRHAVAGRRHPLSPFWPRGLGRPDAPRFLLHMIENDHIRSEREAQKRANTALRNLLEQAVDVTFDALPVPHLEPGDRVMVRTRDFAMGFRLTQASIPLKHDGVMSVNYHKQVSRMRRNRKRSKGKGKP